MVAGQRLHTCVARTRARREQPATSAAAARCRLPTCHRPTSGSHLAGTLPSPCPSAAPHNASGSVAVRRRAAKRKTLGQQHVSARREWITRRGSSIPSTADPICSAACHPSLIAAPLCASAPSSLPCSRGTPVPAISSSFCETVSSETATGMSSSACASTTSMLLIAGRGCSNGRDTIRNKGEWGSKGNAGPHRASAT